MGMIGGNIPPAPAAPAAPAAAPAPHAPGPAALAVAILNALAQQHLNPNNQP